MIANGVLTALLLVLFRGSVTGADADRPPGVARASAARYAGPSTRTPPRRSRPARARPRRRGAARAEDVDTGFAFLWTAAAPAAAVVLAIIFAF